MGDITPSLLLLQLMTGIALGAVYALLALGLSPLGMLIAIVVFLKDGLAGLASRRVRRPSATGAPHG